MTEIWKYILNPYSPTVVAPFGTTWLCAHEQNGNVCVWGEVSPNLPAITYAFEIHGTGHTVKTPVFNRKYLGTCFLEDGTLVLHVFLNMAK